MRDVRTALRNVLFKSKYESNDLLNVKLRLPRAQKTIPKLDINIIIITNHMMRGKKVINKQRIRS